MHSWGNFVPLIIVLVLLFSLGGAFFYASQGNKVAMEENNLRYERICAEHGLEAELDVSQIIAGDEPYCYEIEEQELKRYKLKEFQGEEVLVRISNHG